MYIMLLQNAACFLELILVLCYNVWLFLREYQGHHCLCGCFYLVETLITLMIFKYWHHIFVCRDANIFVSAQEAEELLVIIISLFLDRQLQGLSMILHEGMLSVINFFRDEEWPDSCDKVAKSLACRFLSDTPQFYI